MLLAYEPQQSACHITVQYRTCDKAPRNVQDFELLECAGAAPLCWQAALQLAANRGSVQIRSL